MDTPITKPLEDIRRQLDEMVEQMQGWQYRGEGGRELSLTITNVQQARMWAGEALKEMEYFETEKSE